jgi:hypothetical protein
MFRLLATASSDATKIVEEGALASSTIAQSFDQMWADVINSGGGLYGAISNLGMLFAVGTFVWWAVSFAKALIHDDYIKPAEDIIWVIVVGILLANQGQLLAQSTLGLRGIINQTNQAVLNSTSNSFRLQDAYKQIMQETGKQDVAQGLLSQCASIVDTEQQKACIDNAKAQSQQVAGNGQSPSSGFQKFLNNVGGILQANLFVVAARGLLMSFGIAFQWAIEMSLLLTGLLAPLAVGASLLPVGAKAIFAWLTGFFAVGMTKLSFNIICGLIATMVLNSGSDDSMVFIFFTSVLAPILSIVLASGGGMAVFNSLTSAGSFVAGKVI